MYDCIVIGGGPCGLTAALYLRRANKTVLILEKYMPGGQMAQTTDIEKTKKEIIQIVERLLESEDNRNT